MTSFEEYTLLAEGHVKREQEEWERLRWRVFMEWTISPNLKKRPHTPQDVVRFAWEKDEAPVVENYEPITEEEIKCLCDIFKIERENISNGQDR